MRISDLRFWTACAAITKPLPIPPHRIHPVLAWRGVAWRGVAWRGVASKLIAFVMSTALWIFPLEAPATIWDWTAPSTSVPSDATTTGMWSDLTDLPQGDTNNPDTNWHSERSPVHGLLLRNPNGTEGKLLLFRHFHWYVYNLDATSGPDIVNIGTYPVEEEENGQWTFCSGHSFLPDGRVLVTGGDHSWYFNPDPSRRYPEKDPPSGVDEHYAEEWTAIFDPSNNGYTRVEDMPGTPRWYPTNLTLPDGSVLLTSGNYWDPAKNIANSLLNPNDPNYSPLGRFGANELSVVIPWLRWNGAWSTFASTPLGINPNSNPPNQPRFTDPLYPFFHVLPSGVYYGGAQHEDTIYAGCDACRTHLWPWNEFQPTFDPHDVLVDGEPRVSSHIFNHDHGTSVLLTLEPPYFAWAAGGAGKERVLFLGGGEEGGELPLGGYPDTVGVKGPHRGAEIYSASYSGSPKWEATDPMLFPRRELSGTILPDGKVFVSGGHYVANPCFSNPCGQNQNLKNTPVMPSEMFDPDSESWSQMDDLQFSYGRKYHSTSVLLPDGRILTAGNQQEDGDLGAGHNFEIFYPPYLFKPGAGGSVLLQPSERPTITSWTSTLEYGFPFFVELAVTSL